MMVILEPVCNIGITACNNDILHFFLVIQVILVDTYFDDSMPNVSTFIKHDLTDLKDIEQISAEIIRKLDSRHIYMDGCVSFWEDFAPIAAAICEKRNLVGSNFREKISC